MKKGAIISQCGIYRYSLWREWDSVNPTVLFIGLNPSTADENEDDPTIRRCIGYAKGWGYGKLYMGNLFAFRSTDPRNLTKVEDPVGPSNYSNLIKMGMESTLIIAAWGSRGSYLNMDIKVSKFFRGRIHCLKQTVGGMPAHPLYLKKDLNPIKYDFHHIYEGLPVIEENGGTKE